MPRYFTTGEIPTNGDFVYAPRSIDVASPRILEGLDADKILVLHGCRQMGKTSLARRLEKHLQATSRVAWVDLRDVRPISDSNLGRLEFLYRFARRLAGSIGRTVDFDLWWRNLDDIVRENESASVLLKSFFLAFFPEKDGATAIFVDELDRVLLFGTTWELLLDVTYDMARPGPFSHLRFVFIGLMRPIDLATTTDRPKYQQFEHLRLTDFDISDSVSINAFARGLVHIPEEQQRQQVVALVLRATGGQPFLTSHILKSIVERDISTEIEGHIESLLESWSFGPSGSIRARPPHFDQPEQILIELEKLFRRAGGVFHAYQELLDGRAAPAMDSRTQLSLFATGLVAEDRHGPRLRNPIYRRLFDGAWLQKMRENLVSLPESSEVRAPVASPRPKVLVLNLGGTLGMAVDRDGRLVSPDDPERFFREIPNLRDVIDPIVETPIARPTDGANIVPEDWIRVVETIHRNRARGIVGVLVVAGTDTMAYLASAVAFALGRLLPFPVVFTGAQAPITKVHADAQVNLLRAAQVAACGADVLREVVIVFNDTVLRAVCAEKVDDFRFSAFAAPSEGPLATIGEDIRFQLPVFAGSEASLSSWAPQTDFERGVFRLSQYPGFDPLLLDVLLDSSRVKGVLIESLGVGNVPVVEGYSLLPAIEKARDLGLPVLISGRYPIQPEFREFYQPAARPIALGAIPAGNMTPAAALTKFMWAIGGVDTAIQRGDLDPVRRLSRIAEVMQTNHVGELGRRDDIRPKS